MQGLLSFYLQILGVSEVLAYSTYPSASYIFYIATQDVHVYVSRNESNLMIRVAAQSGHKSHGVLPNDLFAAQGCHDV